MWWFLTFPLVSSFRQYIPDTNKLEKINLKPVNVDSGYDLSKTYFDDSRRNRKFWIFLNAISEGL